MRLTLLIPYLFSFSEDAGLPKALSQLARAKRSERPGDWLDARLCRLFGLRDTPIAALTHALDSGDQAGHWLRADPVHMLMQQESARAVESGALALLQEEADAMIAHLNAFFAGDDLLWQAPRPDRWYVELPRPAQASFTALPLALGRDVPRQTVIGEEGGLWRRRLTEIQMSLFDLPANQNREQRGELPVNHVWLWGDGDFPERIDAPDATVWGDNTTLDALAKAASTEVLSIPSTFERWRKQADAGREHVVVLDGLCSAAWAADLGAWRAYVDALCESWLEPAMTAFGLDIVIEAFEPAGGVVYRWQALDRFKVWKKQHVGY